MGASCRRALVVLAFASANCAIEPPPIDADMAMVLAEARLRLREELVLVHGPVSPLPPTTVVIAGLTRKCEDPKIVRNAMQPCADGNASVLALLQMYDEGRAPAQAWWGGKQYTEDQANHTAFSFSDCAQNIVDAVRGTACRLILARQWFASTHPSGLEVGPCSQHAATAAQGSADPRVRVILQTLAIGRAYAWARQHLPHTSVYVRARLDAALCAPPLPQPALRAARATLVATLYEQDSVTGTRWLSDAYAAMSADVAARYFEAWRVWRPFNCSNVCYAGAGSNACDGLKPLLSMLCTGETPLTKWMCDARWGGRVGGPGGRGGGATNAVHALTPDWRFIGDRKLGYMIFRRWLPPVAYMARIYANMCPSCWPQCVHAQTARAWLCRGNKDKARDKCKRYAKMRLNEPRPCPTAFHSEFCVLDNMERTTDVAIPPADPTVRVLHSSE